MMILIYNLRHCYRYKKFHIYTVVVLEIFLGVVIKKFKSCNIILKKLNISNHIIKKKKKKQIHQILQFFSTIKMKK